MAKLADAKDLGSFGATHTGSNPAIRTILWRQKRYLPEKVRFHRAFFVLESL